MTGRRVSGVSPQSPAAQNRALKCAQIEEAVLKRDVQRGHKCNVRGDLSVSPTALSLHHREVACASYTVHICSAVKPDL